MALEEITRHLGASTTRRTVVKTGVKIAYAAPIVAASFKLSTVRASHVSGGCDGVCCADTATFTSCGAGGCYCFQTTEGTTACHLGGQSCTLIGPCTTSSDCPNGTHCSAESFCPGTCLRGCDDAYSAAASGDGEASSPVR